MKRLAMAIGVVLVPLSASAELTTDGGTYQCERGVEFPVAYVNSSDRSVAILMVEGRLITLLSEQAASGARYAWPSDGSGYVWSTKGDTGTLYWRNGETADETANYADCALKG